MRVAVNVLKDEYTETFKYISSYNHSFISLIFLFVIIYKDHSNSKNKKLKRKEAINYNSETTAQLLNLPSFIIKIQ